MKKKNKNIFGNHRGFRRIIFRILDMFETLLRFCRRIIAPFALALIFNILGNQLLTTIFTISGFVILINDFTNSYSLKELYCKIEDSFKNGKM